MHEARVEFRPWVTAPAMGRRVLSGVADRIPAPTIDDARLLLTEVMTNAIRHGQLGDDDVISVSIRASEFELAVELEDPGRGFTPDELRSGGAAGSGWGLFLLDRLADGWGVVDRGSGGSLVWFRLRFGDGGSRAERSRS